MFKRNRGADNSRKKQKGQSTVEYIVLVTAVIGALIIFMQSGGTFQTTVNGILNQGTNSMDEMSGRLANSYNN